MFGGLAVRVSGMGMVALTCVSTAALITTDFSTNTTTDIPSMQSLNPTPFKGTLIFKTTSSLRGNPTGTPKPQNP